mgnify:CR=1 FL=1
MNSLLQVLQIIWFTGIATGILSILFGIILYYNIKKKKAIKLIDRINRYNFNQGSGSSVIEVWWDGGGLCYCILHLNKASTRLITAPAPWMALLTTSDPTVTTAWIDLQIFV